MNKSEIAEILADAKPETALIIPFEDQSLLDLAKQEMSSANVESLVKADFAGLSPWRLISKLRKNKWDVALCSLHNSTVNRSQSGAEFILGLVRARERFLRITDNDFRRITVVYLLFNLFPRLLLGIIVGLGSVLGLYGLLAVTRLLSGGILRQPPRGEGTVLFLRTDLPGELKAGGSISHTKGMINAFVHSGFRVVYIADAKIPSLPPNVDQIVVKPWGMLDVFDEFQLSAYNFQLLIRSKGWLRQYRPTIVYQRHGILNFSGGLIARKAKVPFVLEANASEVWVKAHWSRLVLKDLARRCESLALDLADRVSVISKGVRQQLEPYGLTDQKIVLNPNGVDPREFHPAIDGTFIRESNGLGNHIVVGFIGTFTKWHGVDTMFDAAVEVVRKNANVAFLMIGDGELRSLLAQRARQAGIERSIIFPGMIPHSEAPSFLAACDILVSPHLGFDNKAKFFGSPTKLFEYMAMGKAIIASKLEQIGEVIRDCENGLLVKPGDPSMLAEKILALSKSKEMRKKIGMQARRDALESYTWSQNVARILESFANDRLRSTKK